jgi:hypothetical protein
VEAFVALGCRLVRVLRPSRWVMNTLMGLLGWLGYWPFWVSVGGGSIVVMMTLLGILIPCKVEQVQNPRRILT